jgi:hypothetical protein
VVDGTSVELLGSLGHCTAMLATQGPAVRQTPRHAPRRRG